MLALPPDWMCAGAESVVPVFHGALHPLRDGCLRLQICPFCGSGSIPLFFDNKRPGLHQQPGALVFAGNLRGRDRNRMDFNPRAPCGARLESCICLQSCGLISIHAPLAGRDDAMPGYCFCRAVFQSTRPLRGATMCACCLGGSGGHFNPRAPCGARLSGLVTGRHYRHFNPRAPCGARLCWRRRYAVC